MPDTGRDQVRRVRQIITNQATRVWRACTHLTPHEQRALVLLLGLFLLGLAVRIIRAWPS